MPFALDQIVQRGRDPGGRPVMSNVVGTATDGAGPLIASIRVSQLAQSGPRWTTTWPAPIQVHENGCPASQSVRRGIAIEWDGEVSEE